MQGSHWTTVLMLQKGDLSLKEPLGIKKRQRSQPFDSKISELRIVGHRRIRTPQAFRQVTGLWFLNPATLLRMS
jgi:hypothetical protein